jgi:transposase-like protein
VVPVHVLVATGVNADGHREILGAQVTSSEDGGGCQMTCVNGRVRRRAGCACSWKETYPDVRPEADLEVQDHAGA